MKNFILILLVPLLFSCSTIFIGKREVSIINSNKNDKIEVRAISNGVLIEENKNGTFSLKNNEKGYIASSSQKNHRTSSRIINRTKFNYLKILDILVPSIAATVFFTKDYGGLNGPIYIVALFGSFAPFIGPWKLYDNTYILNPSTPMEQRKKDQHFIQAIDYQMAVPPNKRTSCDYKNYDNFLTKNNPISKTFTDSISTKAYSFEGNELKILDSFNLRDSNQTFFSNKLTNLKLTITIKSLEETNILIAKKLNVIMDVGLVNNFNRTPLITKEINTSSNWFRYYSFQQNLNLSQRNDVIEGALAKFLVDTEVQTTLTNYKGEVVEQNKVTNEEVIPYNAQTVKTLPEAVKAVVTIITSDGYGSGCIVSNNGYIITNSHVIANNDTSITVQLNDSTQHKATLIVANLKEDLALLKIDTTLQHVFGLDKTLPIEIGQEVYAIGASNIDDYSMSVSKGIISTIRKVDGQTFIQTDGSINRGNSGGALISKDGKLYGIITAKMTGTGIEGVGFAIPYNKLEEALNIRFQ